MAQTRDGEGYITRGDSFTLDPTPLQERELRSCCGSGSPQLGHRPGEGEPRRSGCRASSRRGRG